MGQGNVELLNRAGYDAVTIGNNEGITMSKEALTSLYTDAKFDVILSNLLTEGQQPTWALPSKIYVTDMGIRVGVIGATAEYRTFYSKLGWEVTPPCEALQQMATQLKEQTDVIVCLSHMGVTEDRRLAELCSDIDVIFGAHTHHLFIKGEFVQQALLAATGKYGEYVGHVQVQVDLNQKDITHKEATVYRSDALALRDEEAQEVHRLIETGKQAMSETVFYNPQALTQNLFGESPLASFFGRGLVAYTNADCAMFNAGIFLGSLDVGWVTKGDLHTLLPHPINPCIITLDGAELIEIYELSLNEEWPHIEIKGLGFRGTLMGAMMHERLYRNRHGRLYAGNREVVAGQSYTLATLDMFTFGYFFPTLKHAEKDYCMPELIRDVFGWYGVQSSGE